MDRASRMSSVNVMEKPKITVCLCVSVVGMDRSDLRPMTTFSENPPHDGAEDDQRGEECAGEQKQRAVENGLRLHSCLEMQRRAGQTLAQRLLPREDVASL